MQVCLTASVMKVPIDIAGSLVRFLIALSTQLGMSSIIIFPSLNTRRCNACKYSIGQGEEKDKTDNVRSTTSTTYNLPERGGDMANVIITTYDGKVYTNPEDIKVERNENTEMFYRFLEQYRDERIQKREDTA